MIQPITSKRQSNQPIADRRRIDLPPLLVIALLPSPDRRLFEILSSLKSSLPVNFDVFVSITHTVFVVYWFIFTYFIRHRIAANKQWKNNEWYTHVRKWINLLNSLYLYVMLVFHTATEWDRTYSRYFFTDFLVKSVPCQYWMEAWQSKDRARFSLNCFHPNI